MTVVIIAIVLAVIVILRSEPGCSFGVSELIELSSIEGRTKYLAGYGWEIDKSSEEVTTVLLPKRPDAAMLQYIELQTKQGYELGSYCGLECRRYSYEVTNYPSDSTVYAVLFIKNGRAIGGDIHSAEFDGFMHGIR